LWESLLAMTLDAGLEVCGPEGGEGLMWGVVLLAERGWMAEKSWVMVGWDGLIMGRWRLRDGGWWRYVRAAGLEWERNGVGEWTAVGGGG
jgi:hypothetical protein